MARFVSKAREDLERGYTELLWRRAARDPEFFFEQCLSIPSQRDPRGREEFQLFDYQRDDLQVFHENRFVVLLKGRQLGFSTLVAAYALWMSLFQPGSVILWISDGQENANKAVGMLDLMWRYLPAWAKERAPELTGDQAGKKEWTFADGMTSRIRAYAGTGKAGASETASLVILDEFALCEDQDNLLRSADPTTDAGGSLWIISTARGAHNRFATTFRAAERGESRFVPLFHPWMVSRFINPLADRMAGCPACGGTGLLSSPAEGVQYCRECVDVSLYVSKAREFADQPWLFSAEYPADSEEAFRESGRPRFTALPRIADCDDEWVRGELSWAADGQLRFDPDDDGPLRVRPELVARGGGHPRHDYVGYVDPAQGVGGDATAAQMLTWNEDALPERVAWWWSNTIEPAEVARRMDMLGRWLAGGRSAALLAVECTGGWGDSMLNELQNHLGYPRLYSHTPTGNRKRTMPAKLGFPMNQQRRQPVIDRLAEYVSTAAAGGPLLVGIDPHLRHELGTFVRDEQGRVAADVGCHDDLVMSAAGALWVLFEEARATRAPEGEGTHVSEPAWRPNLQSMFDGIEEQRRQQERREQRARRSRRALQPRQRVSIGRRGR